MTDEDLPFTAILYASTRWDELSVTGWSEAQKRAFLAQQHQAQHLHYRRVFDNAEWLIIERDGRAVGRLYKADLPREIRVIDISLLPESRGAGIGSHILANIQAQAKRMGKCVSIHVEKNNRARALYTRLGFHTAEDLGVYDLMEWHPG